MDQPSRYPGDLLTLMGELGAPEPMDSYLNILSHGAKNSLGVLFSDQESGMREKPQSDLLLPTAPVAF